MAKAYTANNRTLNEWALGGVADYWMSAVIFSFVSIVFVASYKMDPGWVALAMMLPRLVDLIIDPLLGRLSDNTNTRWGRRRPFIFATSIIGAALVIGIWWMPLSWVNKPMLTFHFPWKSGPTAMDFSFLYLLTFTTLLYAVLGVFQMAHAALGYELSDDYNERSKVQAIRSLYFSIGSLFGGYVYWMTERPFFGKGAAGEIHGFRILCFIMAGLVLVFGMIPAFACRERFQNINRKHVAILPALMATLGNRPFVVLLVLRFISILGSSLWGAMVFYIGVYSVCGGSRPLFNSVFAGWNGIAGFVLGFALVPLAAPITRWLGKRRGLIVCYGVLAVGAVLTPLFVRPGHIYLWFFCNLAFMPANVVLGNLLASIMPDICDLDELAHGERREGLFTAVLSFMTKLESSLCTGLGGALLVASGFDQHLNQQPQAVLDKMRLYSFTPLIAGAALTFVVACFFPLGRKAMEAVRAELDVRHAESHILGAEDSLSEGFPVEPEFPADPV